MSARTLLLMLPEAILLAAVALIYVGGAFSASRKAWSWLAGLALAIAGIVLWNQPPTGEFTGPWAADELGYAARWLVLLLGGVFVMTSAAPAANGQAPEVAGSVLLAAAGGMLAVGAGELVLIFLGLEMISIPTYVLLYLGRKDARSQESAAKYFFLSILSSAVMLYGFSFLYGVAGSTQLGEIAAQLNKFGALGGSDKLADLAVVLIFAGLAFKIAAVPFHFYAPDVYQGTTHANAGLLAVLPKAAGVLVLVRMTLLSAPVADGTGWRVALFLAALTMTLGNVLALWQQNLRRLLAYSSIAHAGYLLMGLAAAYGSQEPSEGAAAAVFYVAVYGFATAGAFAALSYLGTPERQLDHLDELAGLGRTRPLLALALAAFMFSLAGIPPLAGFWGKLSLFLSALHLEGPAAARGRATWFILLAVIGAANAAVAAGYYLRIAAAMYFRPAASRPRGAGGTGAATAAGMCLCAVLVIGLLMGPWLLTFTRSAVKSSNVPASGSASAQTARGQPSQ